LVYTGCPFPIISFWTISGTFSSDSDIDLSSDELLDLIIYEDLTLFSSSY
jgi:hypothetical protein